jgi:hypothetical protein
VVKLSANISIDDERDIITAYGVPMAGDLIRAFSEATPEDVWFRIVKTADGVCRIERSILELPRTVGMSH